MENTTPKQEIHYDMSPYLLEYKDGTIHRLAGTETVPLGFEPLTKVTSKDILINPNLPARIYTPTTTTNQKLPLVIYFHGGAFVIASPAFPLYHIFCNHLAKSANAVVLSVDYRLAPENPLPAAFDDAWAAVQWASAHAEGSGPEEWMNSLVDFKRVFLAGDSAGSTLAHHIACRVFRTCSEKQVNNISIDWMIMIHPYFWGSDPSGSELGDPRKDMVDKWWLYVCPSAKGCDEPLINPFCDDRSKIEEMGCGRMIVLVAEKDILCERGRNYYEGVVKSGWNGKVEYFVSKGKDHVFHIFEPDCDEALEMRKVIASFVNHD